MPLALLTTQMSKPNPEYEYTLRRTNPSAEMSWCVLTDGETEWHADEVAARAAAQETLDCAREEGWTATVHVLQCKFQNGEAP